MNKRISIKNLKIRVPAGRVAAPKLLASAVAQQLSLRANKWNANSIANISTSVSANAGQSGSLANSIAEAVDLCVKSEEI